MKDINRPKFTILAVVICITLAAVLITSNNVSESMVDPEKNLLSTPLLTWPPEGKRELYPITRDTFLSSVGEEKNGSNGGAEQLKVKGNQEYAIIDIDAKRLKGKIISGALLHARSASSVDAPLARISVSTVASEWAEGNSKVYNAQIGSSCFNQAEYQRRDWAYQGSNFLDVTLGRGHTIWKFAECSPPDNEGWQSCAVDADVVAARVAGLSYGFSIYDDVGSIWSIKNGRFKYTYFPNIFFYSKESRRNTPWMEVWTKGEDLIPPLPVKSVGVETIQFPAGEALVKWKTPEDRGVGKTLGFNVLYKRGVRVDAMPRYLIPMAGKVGEEVRMHIHDLQFKAGEQIEIIIKPVDSAGNVGQSFTKTIRLSSGSQMPDIPYADIKPFTSDKGLLTVNGIKVAVVDLLDKIDPKSGEMIPSRGADYKRGNHIFSAKQRRIRLQSARNETVYFQLNLQGTAKEISLSYDFEKNQNLKTRIYQFAYVNTTNKTFPFLPDPLIPLTGTVFIPSVSGITKVPEQTNHSLIFELYVPHNEHPGKKDGKVIISTGKEKVLLNVELTVWNFTLPNKLSFIPEMNAYDIVSPFGGYEYYRLAHEHRTCINRLPYGWHGQPSFAPQWDGEGFDWLEWDKHVAPLLDGSAFKDLPRRGEPVDVFYLPLNENWPVSVFENYMPSYWADEALSQQYRNKLGNAFALFAKHMNEKKWHDTIFQFYLNNKVYYRKNFPRSSAPWILDEPVNTQDFWALRWYGILWQSFKEPFKGNAKMWFRGDISFSEFERDMLCNVIDIEYIGANNAQKTRMKQDEQNSCGKSYFFEYGSVNKIEESNIQPVLWCLSAWTKGASGILPWQTIGTENSWKTAEQTALFYPHGSRALPSVRLKAFTAGQQFVEYLTMLSHATGKPRFAVADWLRRAIRLDEKFSRSYESDAGIVRFDETDTEKLWEVRYRLGQFLSSLHPEYKRSLVNWDLPDWTNRKLPDIGYVTVSPKVESYKPNCDRFKP